MYLGVSFRQSRVGPQSETNIGHEPSCDTREIPSVPSPTSCAQSSSWEYPGRKAHGCKCHLVKLHGRAMDGDLVIHSMMGIQTYMMYIPYAQCMEYLPTFALKIT